MWPGRGSPTSAVARRDAPSARRRRRAARAGDRPRRRSRGRRRRHRPGRRGRPRQRRCLGGSGRGDRPGGRVAGCGHAAARAGPQRRRRGPHRRPPGRPAAPGWLSVPGRRRRHRHPGHPQAEHLDLVELQERYLAFHAAPGDDNAAGLRLAERVVKAGLELVEFQGRYVIRGCRPGCGRRPGRPGRRWSQPAWRPPRISGVGTGPSRQPQRRRAREPSSPRYSPPSAAAQPNLTKLGSRLRRA
jgi:hypothetical protein